MASMYQVTLRTADNVPANFIQNQFCVTGPGGDPATVLAAIKGFYDDINATLFSNVLSGTGHLIKGYDLPGSVPNYPFYEQTFDFNGVPNGATLPTEVAVCLSYQGERVSGEPQARKRGRIYLGPIKATNNIDGRPATLVVTTLLDAGEALYDAIAAIPDAGSWGVWSPTSGVATPLVQCSVDDAWDTQRRRGPLMSARTVRLLT